MGIGSAVGQTSTPSNAQAPQPMGGKGAINQAVQPAPTSAPPTAPTSAPQPVGGKGIQQAVQPGQSNFMAPPPGASDATTLKIPSAYTPQVTPMQPGMSLQQFASPTSPEISQLHREIQNQMSSGLQPGVPFGTSSPQSIQDQTRMFLTPQVTPMQPSPQVLPARPPMQQPGPFAGPRPMFQQYLQGQGGLRALMERLRGGYGGMQQNPSQTLQDKYK